MDLPSTRCRAVLSGGLPCEHDARLGRPYCDKHLGPLQLERPASPSEFLTQWRETAESLVQRTMRGEPPPRDSYDPQLVDALLPLALPLYYWYWRVDVYGVENIPTEGPAMIAANHSGALPVDGAVLKMAVLHEHGRNPWLLAADLAFRIPGFRDLLRMAGNARADRDETVRLLRAGEVVGVFPEGFKGIGKGWRKRYQVQRFGRGGLVEVALETGAPIVPVAIVGAEEIYPMIGNVAWLARKLKVPYVPVTPFFPWLGPLGAIPLPSKWVLLFGEPIPVVQHGPEAADDLQLVLELTDMLRRRVQDLINDALTRRRSAFR